MDLIPTYNLVRQQPMKWGIGLSAAVHALALGIFSLWILPSNEQVKVPPTIKIKTVLQEPKTESETHSTPTLKNIAPRKTWEEARSVPPQKQSPNIKSSPVAMQGNEVLKKRTPIAPRLPVPMRETAAAKMAPARIPASRSFHGVVARIAPVEFEAIPANPVQATAKATGLRRTMSAQLLPLRSPEKIGAPSHLSSPATISKASLQLSAHKNLAVHPVQHSAFQVITARPGSPIVVRGNIFKAHPSPARPLPVESSSQMEALSRQKKPAPLNVAGILFGTHKSIEPLQTAKIPPGFSSEILEGLNQISSGNIDELREGYSSQIWKRIAEVKYYPYIARNNGHEGQPVVGFTLENSGQLRDLTLVVTSGHKELDRAALEAVRDASPYPHIPEPLKLNSISFQLPISFILEGP